MMNELINIFIPPENATKDEMDEAKRNMDKYADYRTYLSFDMQQIVHGDKDMTIGLGKMIQQELRRRGTKPSVCCTSCKLCTALQDQSLPKMHR